MFAGRTRAAAVAALTVPLITLAAPAAFADQPTTEQATVSDAVQPLRHNADAPYIWINICVHIPTPGSATLDWCWP
ncbi:hypothetical protein [Nocardia sp. NPDC005978]|uniref:hypothetical protein n=1 Tax=unclassified Nocardia TaxID=2637762 RepID=UPI0033BCFCDE